jgi:broad specificity phosphatase PhoE
MSRALYIVRHGESEYNAKGLLAGITDIPLTDTGREQARQAGAQLAQLGITRIVSSPLVRAYETARIIADTIGFDPEAIIVDERLHERNFGELEGTVWSERSLVGVAGLEPAESVLSRAQAMLEYDASLATTERVLFVAHASLIRAFMQLVDPETKHFGDTTMHMPNARPLQLRPVFRELPE